MGALRFSFVCISLLLGIVLATDAQGQIKSTIFPTPITSEDLDEYSSLLSITGEQRQAIEIAFQKYLKECSEIAQDDIARFSAERRASLRDLEQVFDARVHRKYHRRCLAIRSSLELLDNQFLDQLNSQLPEDQQSRMQHVRQLRQRDRFRWTILRGGRVRHEATIDLTRFIKTIDLSTADHKALEPVMQAYDAALTASVLRYGSAGVERWLLFGDPQEEEDRRRKTIEKGIKIIRVNRRWLATMVSVLTPQTAAKLKDTYLKEVYHGIYPDFENAHLKFNAALEIQTLSDDQKAVITVQRDAYIIQHTQLTEKIIAIISKMRLSPDFWMAVGSTLTAPLGGFEDLQNLMASRKKLNSKAVDTLSEYFGDGVRHSIRIAVFKQYGNKENVRLPKRTPRLMSIKMSNRSMRVAPMGGSPVLALFSVHRYPPISNQRIQHLFEELELSESQCDIAITLYEQYVKELMTQRNAIPKETINSDQLLWVHGEDDSFLLPTLDDVEEIHNAKMRIIEALRQMDKHFFDDMESIFIKPSQMAKLATARRMRMRSLYLQGSGSRLWIHGLYIGGRSKLYELDILTMLDEIEPAEENAEKFNAICDSYDEITAKLAQQRFVAVHDCKLLADQMLIESFNDGDEYYEFSLVGDNALARQFSDACDRLASAEEQYYDLNLSTPKQLMELLTPDTAQLLEDRLRKVAYPDIIKDPQAMHEELESALQKPSLTETMQQAIMNLSAEYSQKYRGLIDKLVAAKRHPRDTAYYRIDDGLIGQVYGSQSGQEQKEINTAKFERKELNAYFQRCLDLIFNPEDD